jgi:hypothetical protein
MAREHASDHLQSMLFQSMENAVKSATNLQMKVSDGKMITERRTIKWSLCKGKPGRTTRTKVNRIRMKIVVSLNSHLVRFMSNILMVGGSRGVQ